MRYGRPQTSNEEKVGGEKAANWVVSRVSGRDQMLEQQIRNKFETIEGED